MPGLQKDSQQRRQHDRRMQQEQQIQQTQPRSGYGGNGNRDLLNMEHSTTGGFLGRSALPVTAAAAAAAARNNGSITSTTNIPTTTNPPTNAAFMGQPPMINTLFGQYQQQHVPQQSSPFPQQLVGLNHHTIDSNLLDDLMPTPIGPGAMVTTVPSITSNVEDESRVSGVGVLGRHGSGGIGSGIDRLKRTNNGTNLTIVELAADVFNNNNSSSSSSNSNNNNDNSISMNANKKATSHGVIIPPPSTLGMIPDTPYTHDMLKELSPTPLPPRAIHMHAEKSRNIHPLLSSLPSTPLPSQPLKCDADTDKSNNSNSSCKVTSSEKRATASKTLARLSAVHKKKSEQKNSKKSTKEKKRGSTVKKNDAAISVASKLASGSFSDEALRLNPSNTAKKLLTSSSVKVGRSSQSRKRSTKVTENKIFDKKQNKIIFRDDNNNRRANRNSDSNVANGGYDNEDETYDLIETGYRSSNIHKGRKSGINRGHARSPSGSRGRHTSRQNSNDDRRTSRTYIPPRLNIMNDEEPNRISNPLLTIVPASFRKLHNGSNHRSGGTRLSICSDDFMNSGTSPNTALNSGRRGKKGNGEMDRSLDTGRIPVGEFMNSASLVFHRPDTYPLSFLARLLGFDVDIPDCNNLLCFMTNNQTQLQPNEGGDANLSTSTTQESSSHMKSVLPCFPTPLPDPQTIPLRKDTVFLKIPAEGKFFQQQKLIRRLRNHQSGSNVPPLNQKSNLLALRDVDDQQTLDYVDPVYKNFLQHGWENHRCKPAGSKSSSKFILKQRQQQENRQSVTKTAQNLLGLSADWKFQDWGSFASQQESVDEEQDIISNSSELNVIPDTATANDNQSTSQQNQESPYHNSRGDPHRRPQWTIDGKEIFSNLPQNIFGILACHREEPVALLKYELNWYQLPKNQNEDNQQKQGADPLEAELIMVIHGFGLRTQYDDNSSSTVRHDNTDVSEVIGGKSSTALPIAERLTMGENETRDQKPGIKSSSISLKLNETVKVLMMAMALEHTRACGVWYGLYKAPLSSVERTAKYFRMVSLPHGSDADMPESNNDSKTSRQRQPMICDLKKCSSRYAMLKMKEDMEGTITTNNITKSLQRNASTNTKDNNYHPFSERLLVKMPSHEKANSFFEDSDINTSPRHSKRVVGEGAASNVYTGAAGEAKDVVFKISVKIDKNDKNSVKIFKPNGINDCDVDSLTLPLTKPAWKPQIISTETQPLEGLPRQNKNDETPKSSQKKQYEPSISWNLLKCFPIQDENHEAESESEILRELIEKQEELVKLEKSLEPQVRNLLAKTVDERRLYEMPDSIQRREREQRILLEYNEIVARRKEFDQVCQDQLEEDMNAVCSICNDGEVTPDNQILFCEACNVAVHQICYGVDKIPEGDYYCISCRHFKRDQLVQSKPDAPSKDLLAVPRPDLPPLPIVCELCPVKHGAFTQLEINKKSGPNDSSDTKWVHMTCAKWQGLNFVNKMDATLVEDVTMLKEYFRRGNISCCICKGIRGAYQKCRFEGCENHCHITCARESGLCEVVHGDTYDGTVPENPWTLLCPDHSQVEEKDKNWTRVEQLIKEAKKFNVDPMPPPLLKDLKPFNKLTGEERKIALANKEYENDFMNEILSTKFQGVRCEVCYNKEDINGKNLSRCVDCGSVICFGCNMQADTSNQRSFQCQSCQFLAERNNEVVETNEERPSCSLCNQKGGLLMKSTSAPILKQSFWKNNPHLYKKSLFTKAKWAHIICAT